LGGLLNRTAMDDPPVSPISSDIVLTLEVPRYREG